MRLPIATSPMPEPAAGDVHVELKRATAAHHVAAEAAFAGFDLRTREGYGDFLMAQAAAVRLAEDLAAGWGILQVLPDWPGRRRAPAILADLEALGLPAPAPLDVDIPAAGDPLGIAYVLEGSRHGARILARRVAAAHDPALSRATGFLGQAFDGERWSTLLAALRQYRTAPAARADLTQAALFAFDLFRNSALVRRGVPAPRGYDDDGGARNTSPEPGARAPLS